MLFGRGGFRQAIGRSTDASFQQQVLECWEALHCLRPVVGGIVSGTAEKWQLPLGCFHVKIDFLGRAFRHSCVVGEVLACFCQRSHGRGNLLVTT